MIEVSGELSTAWFTGASVAFLAKHLLADFLLQTNWMATGKDREEGWILPLAAHAGVHGAMTAVLFLAVAPGLAWLGLVDFVVHGAIDRMKSIAGRESELSPRDTAFWWLFGTDQTLHHLTHLGFVIILAGAAGST